MPGNWPRLLTYLTDAELSELEQEMSRRMPLRDNEPDGAIVLNCGEWDDWNDAMMALALERVRREFYR